MINGQAPIGCPLYRDSSYDRFWATAEEMGAPVTLHSFTGRITPPGGPLTWHLTDEEKRDTPARWWESLNEVQPVLARDFIFGGILDRFPGLQLIISEWEMSWVPSFMRHVDQAQDIGPGLYLPKLEMRASEYLTTRCWHGFIDDIYAQFCVPLVGVDRVIWGSDFPHVRSMGLGAMDTVTDLLDTLAFEEQEKIVGLNAAELFGIN